MRQRVMIAMSLAMEPKVLIADEPTTALDVTVQAQVMDLLGGLRKRLDMAMILITHDLGVVADVADRIAVMYAGRIVEHADVHSLYRNPAHPYTKGLLDSIPRLSHKGFDLRTIKGLPPNLMRPPAACKFHPRCPFVQDICRNTDPPNVDLGGGRFSACHFAREVADGSLG
jgi:oligopeptide/dipeptide ABC transporter ATP-binding protein